MRINEIVEPVWSDRTIGSDVLVWIDPRKLNASWAKDRYSYFDTPNHANAIGNRVERFGEWIKQGIPVNAPEVCLSDEGDVRFINGRHRFFWMLSHGVTRMPVAVPTDYAEEVKRRFE
jgi:hypothetical protein